jgi:hypothetical protein
MVDATISRVRMRDPARLGRFGLSAPGRAGLCLPGASRNQPVTDATGIADRLLARPRAARSRPEASDSVASTI